MGLLSCLVPTVIIMIMVFVFINNYTMDVSSNVADEYTQTLLSMFPILFAIGAVILLITFIFRDSTTFVSEDDVAYYLKSDDVAVEPKTLTVRDAKKILKIRYAKGEINSFEYTERMSRL